MPGAADPARPGRSRLKRRPATLALWASVGASLAIVALTVVVVRLAPPPAPPTAEGPVFPRMRAPSAPLGPGALLRALGIGSLTWYVSILAAPAFVWLSRRVPLERRRWPVGLAAQALLVVGLVFATGLAQYRLSYSGLASAPALGTYLRVALVTGSLPFLAVAALAQAVDARTRAHERALEAAQVRGRLAEARLESLTAQLQPHFLFNTLQGISTLIRADPEAADRMLTRLSDLLREVLARSERREVPVDEELRVLGAYLDICRMRFGERLTVEVHVAPDARDALVPFFVFQPLVENALRHGIERSARPGTVRVSASAAGAQLVLAVADDGPGGDDARDPGTVPGLGLANTRARLEELYPGAHRLEAGTREGGGYEVRIELPRRAGDG